MTDTLIIPRAINAEHYNSTLGAALRSSIIWDTDEVLSQDPAGYEKMRHDTVIAQLVQQRKHEVAGTDWYLEPASSSPADKQIAAIVTALLKKITNMPQALFNLAEAILRGSAWAGMRGAFSDFAATEKTPRMRWWTVTELVDMDKRRFRQVPLTMPGDQTEQPVYGWEIKRPYSFRWEALETGWYIHHTYGDEESSLHFGKGLSNALSQYWWWKTETLKLAMKWLDRWALGILAAKITLDDGARRDPTNAARVNAWLTTLKKMREGYALVYDARDIIEHTEASGTGFEAITQLLDYFDGSFRVLLLGASDPTNPDTGGGSYARAKVQQQKSRSLIKFDRALLESTITRDLVSYLIRVNFPTFCKLRLIPTGIPQFKIRGEDEEDDPAVRAQVIQAALQMGMNVQLEEAYSQLKLTPPAADDKVLQGAQQQPDLASMLQGLSAGPQAAPAQAAPKPMPNRLVGLNGKPLGEGLASAYQPQAPMIYVLQQPAAPAQVAQAPIKLVLPPMPAPQIHVDARTQHQHTIVVPERNLTLNAPVLVPERTVTFVNHLNVPKAGPKTVTMQRDALGNLAKAEISAAPAQ